MLKNKIGRWFNKNLNEENHVPTSRKELIKNTIKIAWPSATEAFLISVIGAVDMMMVGRLGKEAIAAIGISNQPKFILLATIFALNIGVTVIISRRKGQGRPEQANLTLQNSLSLSTLLSVLLSTLGIIFARPFLQLAGAEASYLEVSISYLRIILVGNVFLGMSLTINAAQRGVGNTLVAMKTNLIANGVNVVLNYLLIYGIWIFPQLGVIGAGIATTIGHFCAFVIAVLSVRKKSGYLYLPFRNLFQFDRRTLLSIFEISKSALVEQVFLRIGFLMYIRAVAGLGTAALATHQIVTNVMVISFSIGDGLSVANSSLTGQSLGAKKPKIAMEYGKISQAIGLIIAIIFSGLLALFRKQVMFMFTNDMELVELGSTMLIILSIIILFQIIQVIITGALRGAGDVKFVAGLSLFSVTFLRPVLTYLFAYTLGLGLLGAWISVLVDQVARLIITRHRFLKAKWTLIQV
jgi:putative MATE family efflux protein